MRVFLLEDDFSLNESIKDMLESESFLVDCFYDGKVALDSINSNYDLFILDIFVPNLNGIELMYRIKKENSNSIVFIMSANIDISTIEEAYKKGCDDYIKKPFNIQELLFKLKKYNKSGELFKLEDELFFDLKLKKLIYKNIDIELTKKEKQFLNLLVDNRGSIVNYSLIEDVVYDREYKTIDAIRSLVKRLRKKLPKDIIFTNLDQGYYIK
ncbi:DNA-binding response regulator [Aliarcobacter skirrowii]|jgi:DNA-binding response OmpR family regulator|uniref:Response regulator transcription factor n=3 Tax=Aliarcobacter skirrowii TaxID=28200 RepID=A0AAW9D8C0_9BACT|nr:response regulator transcription factor [Aliarcobacter skirrowii]AZL53325.1 response regulator transcription factor [Aliarcobacter skirrowii]MDD2507796.1 response regulator transcription factor [Aliarcobacter skirrowii]MDD3496516.1 response regulator transcription factor [Aliarcobacter skirrowii]MDX4027170.1 response regulator transcription factor [Aliarcobacter skirrowii]MDX4061131.1 response regulator transcription factor [Aliarcobacter skirrowii]